MLLNKPRGLEWLQIATLDSKRWDSSVVQRQKASTQIVQDAVGMFLW